MTLASAISSELFAVLNLDPNGHYFVAFSGGVDSTVLLHAMTELQSHYGFSLTALHVSHNLQAESAQWAQHCQQLCEQLNVEFKQTSLNLDSSAEESARTARYQWFSEQVVHGSILMTAHHQQDRAETFLFNLMRGAGSTGLSSLRAKRPFYGATLVRPMLRLSQSAILEYAESNCLNWVEDPSNQSDDYSRNDIRHNVIPALETFRVDAIQNIARAAANLEQENGLLREIAICDLVDVREQAVHPIDGSHALCIDDLIHLSPARQANLLRFWLHSLKLHSPSKRFLAKLMLAVNEPPTSTAVLQEAGCQFRFYRGYMYVMQANDLGHDFASVTWQNPEKPVDLFQNKLRLDATTKLRELFSSNSSAELRLVAKDKVVNPKAFQGHSLNLKKWMQEIGVPPWRRKALPLLTLSNNNNDVVLAPVDQYLDNDWVLIESPYF
jgi:tRNA(Ile)-lysidine synthase